MREAKLYHVLGFLAPFRGLFRGHRNIETQQLRTHDADALAHRYRKNFVSLGIDSPASSSQCRFRN